ncbi:Transcription factor TFIIIB component B'', Myb domain [Dillenia turbinata]|uniref:Transcription factor TFIIIB component B'', Myb domain n=1 Tax=Dillenia turbinata TaxID=194707 RepID=A0AAN8UJJ6_9MAGN
MDVFDDEILPDSVTVTNARAGGKFQPKAKPRPRKTSNLSAPSGVSNATNKVLETTQLNRSSNNAVLLDNKEITRKNEVMNSRVGLSYDNVPSEAMKPTSQNMGSGEDIGPAGALGMVEMEVKGSENLNSSIGKSAGQSPNILTELDYLHDILSQPKTVTACAGGKFQPKAKPQPRKTSNVSAFSIVSNATTEESFGFASPSKGSQPTQLVEPSELLKNNEDMISGAISSSDNMHSGALKPTSQDVGTGENTGSASVLGIADVEVNGSENWNSGIEKSVGMVQNSDILLELAYLNDFVSQTTTTTETSNIHASNEKEAKEEPSAQHQSNIEFLANGSHNAKISTTLDPITDMHSGGDLQTQGSDGVFKIIEQAEKDNPVCSTSDMEFVSQPSDSHFAFSGDGFVDGSSYPAFSSVDILDYSAIQLTDSVPVDVASKLPMGKEQTSVLQTLHADPNIGGEAMDSSALLSMPTEKRGRSQKAPTAPSHSEISQEDVVVASTDAGVTTGDSSSRRPNKRRASRKHAAEPDQGIGDEGFIVEPDRGPTADNDGTEYNQNDMEEGQGKKGATRNSMNPGKENEKPSRRRKKASEAPNQSEDQSTKKPPKKFSHSTRRTRRRVDMELLKTAEEEDPKKLRIRDLILLAEMREREMKKEASKSKPAETSQSQRSDDGVHDDVPYDEEDYAWDVGGSSTADQVTNATKSILNYQTYMDKAPSTRWSKQETELFYEAVRQFGSDMSMIQQLFPTRTRGQIKSKFKKEERQHPLRFSDALTNRAKDHSHFMFVIERLKEAAANAEDRDDSFSRSSEAERDEVIPETYDEAATENEREGEATKTEQEVGSTEPKQDRVEDMEADVAEVQSPVKSDDSEDDLLRWSQYTADLSILRPMCLTVLCENPEPKQKYGHSLEE